VRSSHATCSDAVSGARLKRFSSALIAFQQAAQYRLDRPAGASILVTRATVPNP
jgi:hypothetical protein